MALALELALEGVGYRYRGGHDAVAGVDLALAPGIVGLLGPNGAGKSTLMRVLSTLAKATAGVAHGGGRRLAVGDPDFEVLRAWIAGGMPRDPADAPGLVGIEVSPASRSLRPGEEQQLVVTAREDLEIAAGVRGCLR